MRKNENQRDNQDTASEMPAKCLHSHAESCKKTTAAHVPSREHQSWQGNKATINRHLAGIRTGKGVIHVEIPCLDAIIRSVFELLCRVINANLCCIENKKLPIFLACVSDAIFFPYPQGHIWVIIDLQGRDCVSVKSPLSLGRTTADN